ncbi:MAG TPA: hypothetical protein VKE42_07310, partial [Candidatus Cybelea sp.]|nr:hypothetical protein [Candidatus Cybelea sp.]
PLTLNLPGVQVRDLAIDTREGELVAATHGRAFWIMDNIALLEQLARQTSHSVASAQLFTPEAAWLSNSYGAPEFFSLDNFGENPRYGASVYYNLPPNYNGSTPATISFLDANGTTVRSFTLHLKPKHPPHISREQAENADEAQRRQRGLERLTAAEPGVNRFQWDLRYPPGYDYPGFRTVPTDDWADSADGPTIVPGTYTVVLQYGSQRLQAPLKVELDPRFHATPADLQARLALEMELLGSIDRLDRAIASAMTARDRMAGAQRTAIDDEIASLTLQHVSSSEYDVVHPTKIREQLAFLMNSLEGAYAKPTAAEYAAAKDLEALASAGETRLAALAHE